MSERRRTLFLAFEGAYHGDTFGAMSVGRSSGFYGPFEDVLLKVRACADGGKRVKMA